MHGTIPVVTLDNRYIEDLFTKFLEAVALPSIEAISLLKFSGMMQYSVMDPQDVFLRDIESNFRSNLMKEVSYIINIYKMFTSSHHLQYERFIQPTNSTSTHVIAMHVSSNQKECNTYLKFAVYVHNTSLSETAGDTPFFLSYGHEPIKLPDILFTTGMSIRVCQSQ